MRIRTRLSLYFTLVSSGLLLIVLICAYYLFTQTNHEDFYRRLHERIGFASGVYLEADEISDTTLKRLKGKFIISLPEEEIRFYDSSNNKAFIAGTGDDWPPAIINQVREAGHIEYRNGYRHVVGEKYIDNQGTYVILASAVDVVGKSRASALIKIMSSLFGLQLIIQFFVGRWFAANTLHPIQKVNNQIQTITATDLHKRLDESANKDEIGQLAHNFNRLLERIESAFDTHTMFIANASHELKTPLTGMMGQIEVTLSKDRSGDEYKLVLQSILTETERMHVIVEHLLLLAYEENNRSANEANSVRVDDLLWELQDQVQQEGAARLKIVMSSLPDQEELLNICGNKTLLMLALTNIVRNAFKYSGDKDVTISMMVDASTVRIKITDEGIGISEQALKHVFEPFFRSQTDQRYEGSGIGLYIANRIISLYGGQIEVISKLGMGSTFTIVLPSGRAF